MGIFSTAIKLRESEIPCWLSAACDFLLNFNTETKRKPLNMILHVVQMQHADINAMPTKIKIGRLRIVTRDPLARRHSLLSCSDLNLR